MRRQHDVRTAQAVADQRLALVDVEGRSGNGAGFERGDEGGFIHHRTARGIDEKRRALHTRELGSADQVARVGGQRHVQRDEIGFQRVALHELYAQCALDFGRSAAGVEVNHAHAESSRAPRHGAADAAEADDPERFAPYVGAAELVEVPVLPLAGAGQGVALDQAAGDGHEQRPGEVGGGFVEHAGRVAGGDSAGGQGAEVEIVEADGDVGDHTQPGRGGKKLVVHLFG